VSHRCEVGGSCHSIRGFQDWTWRFLFSGMTLAVNQTLTDTQQGSAYIRINIGLWLGQMRESWSESWCGLGVYVSIRNLMAFYPLLHMGMEGGGPQISKFKSLVSWLWRVLTFHWGNPWDFDPGTWLYQIPFRLWFYSFTIFGLIRIDNQPNVIHYGS